MADAGDDERAPEGESPTHDEPSAPAESPTTVLDDDPPLVWALSSFHAAALLVAPLLPLHAVGALGSLLQGVSTAAGLGLYVALWGITWWTNRRWLAAATLRGMRGVLGLGATWGAVTGVGFFAVLLVVVAVNLPELGFLAVLALVGTPVAALIGALAGAGFAVVDLLIVRAGHRLAGLGE
ncbi:MAG: hypothetical protein ABEJ73_03730 [Haloplanus sp.]